jgi:cation diffusion facilitator family transporter
MTKAKRIGHIIFVCLVGIIIDFILSGIKLFVGITSNSIIIFSDAIHNFMDGIGLSIAVLGFALMTCEPTETLPEGYGRLEYLASFILSVLLIGTGVYFAFSSINRLLYPYPVTFTWLRFAVIGATAVAKLLLGFWFKYHNKRLDSGVLKTAQFDSWLDCAITIMALIGFSLTIYSRLRIDAIFGIILSTIIICGGIKLFRENIVAILGDKPDEDLITKITSFIENEPTVSNIEEIKIYDYGVSNRTALITLEFKPDMDLTTLNNSIETIKTNLQNSFDIKIKICLKGGYHESEKTKTA